MLVGQRDNLFERFVGGFPVNDFDHLIDVDQEITFDFLLSATLHMEMCRFVVVRPKPDRQSRYLKCSHPRRFYLSPLSDIFQDLLMPLSAWL